MRRCPLLSPELYSFRALSAAFVAVCQLVLASSNVVHAQPAIGFIPRIDFITGNGAWSVAAADYNGDGLLDIGLGLTNWPVQVYLGDGFGRFGSASTTNSHGSNGIAFGDLDDDGDPDIVLADVSIGFQVLLNNGDGTFGAPSTPFADGHISSVAVGDVNGDSILDVIAANPSYSTVVVLRGVGNGSFAPATSVGMSGSPRTVAVADINGDDNLDLVVTLISENLLSVHLGDGSGSFPSHIETGTGRSPIHAAVGDINGDTYPDVAVTNSGASTVSVLLGMGNGAFGGRRDFLVGTTPYSIALGDLNYDGLADLAVVNAGSHSVSILAGVGNGDFLPKRDLPVGASPVSVVAVDVNRDATSDLITANLGDNTVSTLLQCGAPALESVIDVSNDQGGRVALRWRFAMDRHPYNFVTGYRVWRAVDGTPTGVGQAVANQGNFMRIGSHFWEPIAEMPSAQLSTYGYVAPTVHDSVPGSNPLTAFFVQALTSDPNVYYVGEPDSGYSVDNLSPPPPLPFAASYEDSRTVLHWKRSPAPDFGTFKLHRGSSAAFIPGPSNLIAEVSDTAYVDGPGSYFYKLAAVDLHGNSSLFAVVSPGAPTAALVSLANIDVTPERVSLTWYAASSTTLDARVLRRTMESSWDEVARITTDGTGALRYEDRDVVLGTRYGYRLAIVDRDVEYESEEVWLTVEAPVLVLAGVQPNPSSDGEFSVHLILPKTTNAKLELMDVAGRRVALRQLSSLGPGRHEVRIAGDVRLRPGIYIVRLTSDAVSRMARAVVVR